MKEPPEDDSGVVVPVLGNAPSRVRTCNSRAASEIERWNEMFAGRGGSNVFTSMGSSCHAFILWFSGPPFNAPFASWMLSCRSFSWPAMKFAFVASPVHRVVSTTSKQALIRVRVVVSCSSTITGAEGWDERESLKAGWPRGGGSEGRRSWISPLTILAPSRVM